MADEATDVQTDVQGDVQSTDITPEDFMADEQESPKADSSPAEDKKPEVVEKPKEEAKAESEVPKETESKEDQPEKAEEPEADKPEEKPQTKAEERKSQLNTEIRDLVAQRNALKEEVAKANEVYQPATEQELQDEGMSANDAKVEALRQEIEISKYNDKVADAQLTIEHESNKILSDFAWTNPESPEYKEELSQEAAQLLQANLIFDENTGQVIGSNISPYQLYKTLDRASGISAVQGQLKGQQAAEQQLANADPVGSTAPPKQKVDPIDALWSEPL